MEGKFKKSLTLFWTFFKIGAFTFGGGYAMLPMLEREIVANIVRYNHLEFDYSMENSEGIDREEYLTIVKLTAILQIANALDRSHKQKCRDIKAVRKDDKLILTITTNEDITLERCLFGSRAEFFREVYSIEPVIRQKRIL